MVPGGKDQALLSFLARQLICTASHVDRGIQISANTANDTEAYVNEKCELNQSTAMEMCQMIEMPRVVAFELESNP